MTHKSAALWVAGGLAAVLAAGLALAPGMALAEPGQRWLHVRVVDGDQRGESVRVNLPVSVLETMAQSIQDEHFKDGRIAMGGDGVSAEQLREVWKSIRGSKDMEFVTIQSDDESVRVAKSGKYLLAKVDGHDGDGERVEVRVPLDVIDALLQAPDGKLNVKAALHALAQHEDGAIVQVHDGASEVKVWIDSRAEADV